MNPCHLMLSNIIILLSLTVSIAQNVTNQRIIKVGVMIPKGLTEFDTTISFKKTAGAITVGMNKIFADGLLSPNKYNFS